MSRSSTQLGPSARRVGPRAAGLLRSCSAEPTASGSSPAPATTACWAAPAATGSSAARDGAARGRAGQRHDRLARQRQRQRRRDRRPGIDVCLVDLPDEVQAREARRPAPAAAADAQPAAGAPADPRRQAADRARRPDPEREPGPVRERLTLAVPVRNLGPGLAMSVRVIAGRQTPFVRSFVVFDMRDSCVFARDTSMAPPPGAGSATSRPAR